MPGGEGGRVTPQVRAGVPSPLGAHLHETGINFAIFSRHATAVSLLLFGSLQNHKPPAALALDPRLNRTGDIWHLWVDGIGAGTLYA